jgi:hypothetical protein
MADLDAQWQQLCKECDTAQDAVYRALAPVIQKSAQIAQKKSRANPSDDELSRLEKARDAWDDIKRRMDEFINAHIRT